VTENGATSRRQRGLRLIGRAVVILLLISSMVPNVFLLMFSTAPGGAPLGWMVGAHPLVALYALMLLVWRRGEPWTWRLVFGLGLLPWMAFAALMLL
jgi:hypothetical protein